jgi:hypothetical protein
MEMNFVKALDAVKQDMHDHAITNTFATEEQNKAGYEYDKCS